MPSIKQHIQDSFSHLFAAKHQRRNNLELLPADLTGHVVIRCREEAEKIRGRIAWLNEELVRVDVELVAARQLEKAARVDIVKPVRQKGFDILQPGPMPAQTFERFGMSMKTAASLKIHREKVLPLLKYRLALKAEKTGREQEIGELKRIALAATNGELGLIHHLSQQWLGRLEIGRGFLGKLPAAARALASRNVIQVDMAGYPLPPEALDATGEPDMEMTGRRVPYA